MPAYVFRGGHITYTCTPKVEPAKQPSIFSFPVQASPQLPFCQPFLTCFICYTPAPPCLPQCYSREWQILLRRALAFFSRPGGPAHRSAPGGFTPQERPRHAPRGSPSFSLLFGFGLGLLPLPPPSPSRVPTSSQCFVSPGPVSSGPMITSICVRGGWGQVLGSRCYLQRRLKMPTASRKYL
jgi:hypothetical protein